MPTHTEALQQSSGKPADRSALHRSLGLLPVKVAVLLFCPSGIDPVALPYTTFDVIVRIDVVGSESTIGMMLLDLRQGRS